MMILKIGKQKICDKVLVTLLLCFVRVEFLWKNQL